MRTLSNCDLIVGAIGMIIFLLTGQYMDHFHNHLVGMADGPRMLYRSAHIYFLLSCIFNLCLVVSVRATKSYLQMAISVVVLIAPALFLIGFFLEPSFSDLHRPYTRLALNGLFGAGVILIILNLYQIISKRDSYE
ncbi:MAG: hypothetical protein KTR16_14590 [Acidiferrobacterales bacterium]|nr:hypothetical protein [Acidiferrobacterales bacterium]